MDCSLWERKEEGEERRRKERTPWRKSVAEAGGRRGRWERRGEGAIQEYLRSSGGGPNWPKAQLVQNMFSEEDIPPPVGPLLFLF